jgi:phage terminase large subunit GpA-like protein
MATCDTCGNDYDKTFTITRGEKSGTFDSFECAAHAMAPTCAHCGCRILGHGVEIDGTMFCCANCATQRDSGAPVADRA